MLASYGRRLLMVAVAATLVGCSSVESSGSVIVESVSTLSVGEGEVVVRLVVTTESDVIEVGHTDPSLPLTNAWFWVVPLDEVDEFWSLLIPDESSRAEVVLGARATALDSAALVNQDDLLAGAGLSVVINDEEGQLEIALIPGDYLVCRVVGSGESPDGSGYSVGLSGCRELGVDGDTTWSIHYSGGEGS